MEDRAIHTSPTRWLHYYSSTTDTANSGLQKVDTRWLNKTYFPKQAIQLESFEGDNLITQSKPSMFSRLLSKFRSIGKKKSYLQTIGHCLFCLKRSIRIIL